MKAVGYKKVRCLDCARFREEEHFVGRHRLVQRRTLGFPVGDEFGDGDGIHHGAGQDMRAGLRAFFKNHDRDVGSLFCSQLFQANGRGKSAGAAAHDDHVVFHGFTGAELGKYFLVVHGGGR